MRWIKLPGTVGTDGKTIDRCTNQLVAGRSIAISINGIAVGIQRGELTCDDDVVFCDGLSCGVGGFRGVVSAVNRDLERVCISEFSGVSHLIVHGDDLGFTSGEAVVSVDGWIKLPRAIRIDRQSIDRISDQRVSRCLWVGTAIGIE